MAYYIVFKNKLDHPLLSFKYTKRKKPPQYEIWKEYHEDMIFDAPTYEILEYFDTRKEAQSYVRNIKTGGLNDE